MKMKKEPQAGIPFSMKLNFGKKQIPIIMSNPYIIR
jgi:hypothetical protein